MFKRHFSPATVTHIMLRTINIDSAIVFSFYARFITIGHLISQVKDPEGILWLNRR